MYISGHASKAANDGRHQVCRLTLPHREISLDSTYIRHIKNMWKRSAIPVCNPGLQRKKLHHLVYSHVTQHCSQGPKVDWPKVTQMPECYAMYRTRGDGSCTEAKSNMQLSTGFISFCEAVCLLIDLSWQTGGCNFIRGPYQIQHSTLGSITFSTVVQNVLYFS